MAIFGIVFAVFSLIVGCYLVSKSSKADSLNRWIGGDVNPVLTLILMFFCYKKDKAAEKKGNEK